MVKHLSNIIVIIKYNLVFKYVAFSKLATNIKSFMFIFII